MLLVVVVKCVGEQAKILPCLMVSWQRILSLWKAWGHLPGTAFSIHMCLSKHADSYTASAAFWSSHGVLELVLESSASCTSRQLLWSLQVWSFLCEVRLYRKYCMFCLLSCFLTAYVVHTPHAHLMPQQKSGLEPPGAVVSFGT